MPNVAHKKEVHDMNEKMKRSLGSLIIAIIVILAVIQTPSILSPVLKLGGIVFIYKVLCFILKTKDNRDQKSAIDYGKIPDKFIAIVAIVAVIVILVVFLKPILTNVLDSGNLIGGVMVGICMCVMITKKTKKDLENDKNERNNKKF